MFHKLLGRVTDSDILAAVRQRFPGMIVVCGECQIDGGRRYVVCGTDREPARGSRWTTIATARTREELLAIVKETVEGYQNGNPRRTDAARDSRGVPRDTANVEASPAATA